MLKRIKNIIAAWLKALEVDARAYSVYIEDNAFAQGYRLAFEDMWPLIHQLEEEVQELKDKVNEQNDA
jgi:hypothetical protein